MGAWGYGLLSQYFCKVCSDHERIRKHLDSGVLIGMIAQKEAIMLSIPTKEQELEYYFRDPGYVYVLLGACATTLGCQIPESFVTMLRIVYTEVGLMPDARKQMKEALNGVNHYKNGKPYDFGSKSLVEVANEPDTEDKIPNQFGFIGLNVPSPGGLFNTGMGNSSTSIVMKELRAKHNNPDVCAGCGTNSDGTAKVLLVCSRCKDRKYCSVKCQKQHWADHKKVCQATVMLG